MSIPSRSRIQSAAVWGGGSAAVGPGVPSKRAKRPKRIPAVFTHAESMAILDRLRAVNWLICKLLYGSGLRGIEALRLRVKDLDFDRLQITIRDAKGQKELNRSGSRG